MEFKSTSVISDIWYEELIVCIPKTIIKHQRALVSYSFLWNQSTYEIPMHGSQISQS